MSLNKVLLIGNLGKEPEMSYTPNGQAVTKFSLAVNRRTKVNGERKDETQWFSIVAWGQLAETCNTYLHKGSKVYIEGRIASRDYQDKEGVKRTAWEVTANEMLMLDGKPREGGAPADDSGVPF